MLLMERLQEIGLDVHILVSFRINHEVSWE
jgi:hypothetical protein